MTELKPCPFCGNSPRVNDLVDEYKQVSFAVSCDKCGCNIGLSHDTNWLGHLFTMGDFSTEADAKEAWNSRPSPWIKIEFLDDLPIETDLLFHNGSDTFQSWVNVCMDTGANYIVDDEEATHWMPLPEAPKESL